MRYIFFLFIMNYLVIGYANAQQPIVDMGNNGSVTTIRFNNVKANQYDVLRGNPYLSESFQKANFQLNNGQWTTDGMEARLNTYSQQIEYKRENEILTSSLQNIKAFKIGDALFKTGFEKIDKQTTASFYQIFYEGKTALIKYTVTEMKEVKNFDDTKQGNEFVTYQYYYFVDTLKRLHRVMLNKKNILKTLPENQVEMIESYLKEKNMKLKTWEEIIELLKYIDAK